MTRVGTMAGSIGVLAGGGASWLRRARTHAVADLDPDDDNELADAAPSQRQRKIIHVDCAICFDDHGPAGYRTDRHEAWKWHDRPTRKNLTNYAKYVLCVSERSMQIFTAAELQRNASELQRSAIKAPVLITHHDAPRFVLMTVEDYLELGGRDPLLVTPDSSQDGHKAESVKMTGTRRANVGAISRRPR